MGKTTKWSKDKFVEECKKVYGDEYDYSNTIYNRQQDRIKVMCPIHDEFEQWAQHFLKGVGCPKCSGKIGNEDFINKSSIIHNDKYNYSKTNYTKTSNKVLISCPEHGEFKQYPYYHLKGIGCPKCSGRNKTNEEIIKKFREIHDNKYDYSKLNYVRSKEKLTIICKKHGEFKQLFNNHLKYECPRCSGKIVLNEDFIEKSNMVHDYKYDYSKTKYIKASEKVTIICKIHGDFEQNANSHFMGIGCPKCSSSKGEIEISKILKDNLIEFFPQKKFENCKNIFRLSFDFYLPKYKICIEYDGLQHFEKYRFEYDDRRLNKTIKRDKIKTDFCLKNDIKLIRIKYNENIKDKLQCQLNINLTQIM